MPCPHDGRLKDTVLKLLVDLGTACAAYHDEHVRNLHVNRVQCDEIWNFCYAKAKNAPEDKIALGAGDVWTWIAMDADTKLGISYLVRKRHAQDALWVMQDLANRLKVAHYRGFHRIE